MKPQIVQIHSGENNRLGGKLRQEDNAPENQWVGERDRESLAEMRRMRSERQLSCKIAWVSPTFARILCPTDFGDNSLEALDLAKALTAYHDATLYVLHVSQPNANRLQEAPQGGASGMETASARLDELVAKRLGGARHHSFITAGDPAGKIVEMSREIRADLVVVGTHAQSTFGRLLLGSVTERVLGESNCPVLVTFRK